MATVILGPLALHRRQPHWPESLLCSHLVGYSSVGSLLCSRHHSLVANSISTLVEGARSHCRRPSCQGFSKSTRKADLPFSNVSICSEEHDIEPSDAPAHAPPSMLPCICILDWPFDRFRSRQSRARRHSLALLFRVAVLLLLLSIYQSSAAVSRVV